MKVVILAGGQGTRLREVSKETPKPMVEIGGKPILWHIMSHYASYGFKEFVICLGYNGYVIKDFFLNYAVYNADISVDLQSGAVDIFNKNEVDWRVHLVDTGQDTMTGGRIKRVQDIIGGERFFLTYGDAVSNVPIDQLLDAHMCSGKGATVTAVVPQGRFGVLDIGNHNEVRSFVEKPTDANSMINGGFFVIEPTAFELITGDKTVFEQEPLRSLCDNGELNAFPHKGFWQCMDTPRDWELLEKLAKQPHPPWTQKTQD